jgi:hypothetical protein
LIDKPLGSLFPTVLGSGRTIFHALGIVCIILLIVLLLMGSNYRLPGVGILSTVFLHQVFDEMWSLPTNWFYPILGPFNGPVIPDYIGTYFWFEVTNPSEWLFLFGTLIILEISYKGSIQIPAHLRSDLTKISAYMFIPLAFGTIGLYLVAAGLLNPAGTFITPFYDPVTNVMAGLIPLFGAILMHGK